MQAQFATPTAQLAVPRVIPRARRHEEWLVVRITHAGAMDLALSVDVSPGGMCLQSDTIGFEVGQRVRLEFSLPLVISPVIADAVLRWVDEGAGLCGVQFATGLRAREVWAIQLLGRAQRVSERSARNRVMDPGSVADEH